MKMLMEYPWPGNIRELENLIKRAVILAKGNVINPELLFEGTEKSDIPVVSKTGRLTNYLTQQIISKDGEVYKLVLEEIEKDLIEWAMNKTGGNQLQAAKLLGISRVMLHDRLERFQLK